MLHPRTHTKHCTAASRLLAERAVAAVCAVVPTDDVVMNSTKCPPVGVFSRAHMHARLRALHARTHLPLFLETMLRATFSVAVRSVACTMERASGRHVCTSALAAAERVPYTDGVYENPDGSPVDITESLAYRDSMVGGGGSRYSQGWERVFAKKSAGNPQKQEVNSAPSDAAGSDSDVDA